MTPANLQKIQEYDIRLLFVCCTHLPSAVGSARCIVSKRINQDIVEHHFGRTRVSAGSTDAPTGFQCHKADQRTQVLRYLKEVIIRGNVSEG
jgi:hypothetical protein